MANSGRPETNEYGEFYGRYVALVPEDDICAAVEAQARDTAELLATISEEKSAYRYAPGKWSIKQLLGHVADAERVFGYRALCIARGDTASLPGFDENDYMSRSSFDRRPLASIVRELQATRQSSIALFRGFDDAVWTNVGTANDQKITVRGVAYALLGHERHHLGILRERYLP